MDRAEVAQRLAMLHGHLKPPPIVDFVCTVDGRQILCVEGALRSSHTHLRRSLASPTMLRE